VDLIIYSIAFIWNLKIKKDFLSPFRAQSRYIRPIM